MNAIKDTVSKGADFELKIKVPAANKNDFNKNHADTVPPEIDQWLRAHDYNEYGDPPGTYYLGGTPLYNECTGKFIPRISYILSKHPELRQFLYKRDPICELKSLIQDLIDIIES